MAIATRKEKRLPPPAEAGGFRRVIFMTDFDGNTGWRRRTIIEDKFGGWRLREFTRFSETSDVFYRERVGASWSHWIVEVDGKVPNALEAELAVRDYFKHVASTGRDPLDLVGFSYYETQLWSLLVEDVGDTFALSYFSLMLDTFSELENGESRGVWRSAKHLGEKQFVELRLDLEDKASLSSDDGVVVFETSHSWDDVGRVLKTPTSDGFCAAAPNARIYMYPLRITTGTPESKRKIVEAAQMYLDGALNFNVG